MKAAGAATQNIHDIKKPLPWRAIHENAEAAGAAHETHARMMDVLMSCVEATTLQVSGEAVTRCASKNSTAGAAHKRRKATAGADARGGWQLQRLRNK